MDNPAIIIQLIVIGVISLAIFTSGIVAFRWALRTGKFARIDEQAVSIFDEEEPEGMQTDFFPGKRPQSTDKKPTP